MNLQDIKLMTLNSVSLLISMTQVETTLKIILLLISIGYTAQKWYEIYDKKKDRKDK